MGDVVGPEADRLGEGWFINQHIAWPVGDEDVAEMKWRILKFSPAESGGRAGARRPRRRRHDASRRIQRHQVLLGRRQSARTADPAARRRQPAAPPGARALAGQGDGDRLRRRQRQWHGVQLRRAPRAEGARPYPAVRHRPGRIGRRRADARRAARRRSVDCGDRNAGAGNVHRLSRPTTSGRPGRNYAWEPSEAENDRADMEVGTKLPDQLYGDPTFICRRRSPPATTRTCTTTGTRRRPRGPRTSSSTS